MLAKPWWRRWRGHIAMWAAPRLATLAWASAMLSCTACIIMPWWLVIPVGLAYGWFASAWLIRPGDTACRVLVEALEIQCSEADDGRPPVAVVVRGENGTSLKLGTIDMYNREQQERATAASMWN